MSSTATPLTAFAPVSRADATVLILGSMPGVASLEAQRYYAHPQNAFWFIMASLHGDSENVPEHYDDRINLILNSKIALWDVLKHCIRPGSLDSKIERSSVVCNDFRQFFRKHTSLKRIGFNGKTAEQLFRKHVTSDLPDNIELVSLPSTSPAMATMTREQKTAAWRKQLGQ